jgi:hypothetical protein
VFGAKNLRNTATRNTSIINFLKLPVETVAQTDYSKKLDSVWNTPKRFLEHSRRGWIEVPDGDTLHDINNSEEARFRSRLFLNFQFVPL